MRLVQLGHGRVQVAHRPVQGVGAAARGQLRVSLADAVPPPLNLYEADGLEGWLLLVLPGLPHELDIIIVPGESIARWAEGLQDFTE